MKIKTNAKCAGCSAAIKKALEAIAPAEEWAIDLNSPDKVLTYLGSTAPSAQTVIALIKAAGFQAEEI